MKNYKNMTLDQLRTLPGYTSGSSCNLSLQRDIEFLYNELDTFTDFYGTLTQAQLCAYLRDLANDIEYRNIPEMRQIQWENHYDKENI